METPSIVLLSRQNALQRQMEVVANNIANSNTTGFKAQDMVFETFVARPSATDEVDYVIDRATMRDMSIGAMMRTGNELDVALQSEGYFAVQTPAGVRYTRAGSFSLDPEGNIVTPQGYPVMGDGGSNLTVPLDAQTIEINPNGRIMSDRGEVGSLQISKFAREQEMIEIGGGLYETNEAPQTVEFPSVVQGAIEQSNVRPVVEMTQITEVLRAYQQTQRLIESEHERMRSAIRTLGRVSAS